MRAVSKGDTVAGAAGGRERPSNDHARRIYLSLPKKCLKRRRNPGRTTPDRARVWRIYKDSRLQQRLHAEAAERGRPAGKSW